MKDANFNPYTGTITLELSYEEAKVLLVTSWFRVRRLARVFNSLEQACKQAQVWFQRDNTV